MPDYIKRFFLICTSFIVVLPLVAQNENFGALDTVKQRSLWFVDGAGDSLYGFQTQRITRQEFERAFKQPNQLTLMDNERVNLSDSLITIHTENGDVSFVIETGVYFEYQGYLDFLDLHFLMTSSASSAIAYQIAVDGKTGFQFGIECPFDNGTQGPIVSPDKTHLLFYANDVFEINVGAIVVYNVESDHGHFVLSPFTMQMTDTEIVSAAWTSNNSVAIYTKKSFFEDGNVDEAKTIQLDYKQYLWMPNSASAPKKH